MTAKELGFIQELSYFVWEGSKITPTSFIGACGIDELECTCDFEQKKNGEYYKNTAKICFENASTIKNRKIYACVGFFLCVGLGGFVVVRRFSISGDRFLIRFLKSWILLFLQ
ncbi:MAG: hypothetical protein LBE76_05655 [Nitrososphaerota archaeon]|jgi:hypothetical protein|nr:hypothetical protein [Nitrososphaerota archaeon]